MLGRMVYEVMNKFRSVRCAMCNVNVTKLKVTLAIFSPPFFVERGKLRFFSIHVSMWCIACGTVVTVWLHVMLSDSRDRVKSDKESIGLGFNESFI